MEEKEIDIIERINALLVLKKYAEIRDLLIEMNPVDIANLFGELPMNRLPVLFRLLPKELGADTFVEMEPETQEHLIKGFSDNELKEVLEEIYLDDTVDLLEEMPANVVKRILINSEPETRKQINEILKYPEDSAGSLMTTEYVSLRRDMTAYEALKRIRRTGIDKETIYTCYVTKSDRKLIGIVTARSLLLAEEDALIDDIMNDKPISVNTHTDKEDVADIIQKYDLIALPVVDDENRLVGIVTIDDAIDVIKEEATEDIEKMAGMLPSDKPYLRTGVFETWKARIPWLLFLMLSALFTQLIITHFEATLTLFSLSAFIPMITGTAGNSGSQSSVAVIRALSLGEIEFKNTFRILFKEVRVAFFCGLTLAVANMIKALIQGAIQGNFIFSTSLVVSITILITVIIAKIVGSLLPILAEKIGFDPAVMASPLITTVLDSVSLLVFATIAVLLLY